jgi:intracellular multiplication protein IcmK
MKVEPVDFLHRSKSIVKRVSHALLWLCLSLCVSNAFASLNDGGSGSDKAGFKTGHEIEKEYIGGSGIRQRAFSQVPMGLLPMSPGQIKLLHRLYNRSQRAMASEGDVPPRATSTSLTVDLSPGSTMPVVRLASGYVSSLIFLDVTGKPWPIQSYDLGNPNAFSIQWRSSTKPDVKLGSDTGNTLIIQALTLYKHANLAVTLQGMNTPIMLTLVSGQKAVDYRVDVHVPKRGPLASPFENADQYPDTADGRLMGVLNNVSSKSMHPLVLKEGVNLKAWKSGHYLFARSPLTIISPSWIAKMSSSDGAMHAYKLPYTSVLLVLDGGKLTSVTLEEGM